MKTQKADISSIIHVLGFFLLGLCLVEAARAGSFSITSALSTPRYYHTATLLPDGRVLVVGGSDGTNLLSSVELYDPATGTWTNTGAMTIPRVTHTATLLTNGLVLVAGGFDASAELFDPTSGTWTATGPMHLLRAFHSATMLNNGLVLVAGGAGGDNRTELYDSATGTWTWTGSLNENRWYHSANLLPNGKVLVTAGYIYDGIYDNIASAELYDPVNGIWSPTSPLPVPNEGNDSHTATLLTNGLVLVAGGHSYNYNLYGYGGDYGTWSSYFFTAELYNPATETWTVASSMSTERAYATATLLPNGKVLVAGGYGAGQRVLAGTNGYNLASAELYDASTGTWKTTGAMYAVQSYETMTLLTNGLVLVAGGTDGTNALATAELYDDSATGVASSINLTKPVKLPDGTFQFTFTNTSGAGFNALATTNLVLPMSEWTRLGDVTEIIHGQFQFTDPDTANFSQRFYRVSSH